MATARQKIQVGLFLVICAGLLAGTLLVLGGWQRETSIPYFIEFDESVSGLFNGAAVRYRGVPVGRVKDISVLPSMRVRVRIESRPSVMPLREGSQAQLGATGITGQLYINLTGGDPEGRPLPAGVTIPSTPSLLANLSAELPTILASIDSVLLRIDKTLGDEGGVAAILGHVETLLPNFNNTVSSLGAQSQTLLQQASSLLEQEVRPLLAELRSTTRTTRGVLERTETSLQPLLANSTRVVQQLEKQLETLQLARTNTQVQAALQRLSQLAEQFAPIGAELERTLQQLRQSASTSEFHLRQAVRSLQETLRPARELFDHLERDPAALLFGKERPAPTP